MARTKRSDNALNISNYLNIMGGSKVQIVNMQSDLDDGYNNQDDDYWANSLESCGDNFEGYDLKNRVFTVSYVNDEGVFIEEIDLYLPWFSIKLVEAPTYAKPKCSTETSTPYYKGRKVWVNGESVIIEKSEFDLNSLYVTVVGSNGKKKVLPYYEVALYQQVDKVNITLNNNYTATYLRGSDVVKVGCHEIPVEKVLALAKEIQESKKK